jgi:hypothetical protein
MLRECLESTPGSLEPNCEQNCKWLNHDDKKCDSDLTTLVESMGTKQAWTYA